jgi:hypothetical protein
MKSLQDLPAPRLYISKGDTMYPAHIIIPQLDGTELAIITHDVTTASKILVLQQAILERTSSIWFRRVWIGLIAFAPSRYPKGMHALVSSYSSFQEYCGGW